MHPLVKEYLQLRLKGYGELLAMDLALWQVNPILWITFYRSNFTDRIAQHFAPLLKDQEDCAL